MAMTLPPAGQAASHLRARGVGVVRLTGPKPAARPAGAGSLRIQERLRSSTVGNRFTNSVHNCFQYAWHLVRRAGGATIDAAASAQREMDKPLRYLGHMVDAGILKPGMIIYVNLKPGADPSSTQLRYGPHWFAYMGHGLFRDQYGTKTLAQMEAFVPGRKIDTIYDPFAWTRR